MSKELLQLVNIAVEEDCPTVSTCRVFLGCFDDIQPYQRQGLTSACLRCPTGGSYGLEVLLRHSDQCTRHRLPLETRKLMGRLLQIFLLVVLSEGGVSCDESLSCQTLAPAAL